MRLKLRKLADAEQPSVVRLDHTDVVFRGPGGDDFLCPHCDKLLAEAIERDSIIDVVVECNGCKKAAMFPSLSARVVTTPVRTVPLQSGIYRLSSTITIAAGTRIVPSGFRGDIS